ncbi:hypothetical protein Ancab_032907 [Ancistrocladus abbreviatus]
MLSTVPQLLFFWIESKNDEMKKDLGVRAHASSCPISSGAFFFPLCRESPWKLIEVDSAGIPSFGGEKFIALRTTFWGGLPKSSLENKDFGFG